MLFQPNMEGVKEYQKGDAFGGQSVEPLREMLEPPCKPATVYALEALAYK